MTNSQCTRNVFLSLCHRILKYIFTNLLFGPFGIKNGNAMPIKPQNIDIIAIGVAEAPIFLIIYLKQSKFFLNIKKKIIGNDKS